MPPSTKYQIAIIDPSGSGRAESLRQTIRGRVAELGLDPTMHLCFLDEGNYAAEVQGRDPLVGVYFGGLTQTNEATRTIEDILHKFAFVLPIVDSTDSYSAKVPECLRSVNGLPLDPADAGLERPAGRLLEELRLVRQRRVAFISYRRSESRGVGSQLFHALEERHYRVFLDTFSVQYGRPFQEVLWNRMLDTDILAFLHTRTALSSRWVEEEFAKAGQLGLGVLNVVWPGHTPPPAAALGERFELEPHDFAAGASPDDDTAQLTDAALARVTVAVESLRARAFWARRRRVVDAFCRRVDAFIRRTGTTSIGVVSQPRGYIEVRIGRRPPVRVYPVIGHPDTTHAHEISDACAVEEEDGYLLFDANGIDSATETHLRWLNRHLPVKAFSTTEVEAWLPNL